MNKIQKPRNNSMIKILSVVAAFFLWLYVMNEQNPVVTRNYTVNLELRNAAKNMVFDADSKTVRIRVSGPMATMSEFSVADIKAYVDLQGMDKGVHVKKVAAVVPDSIQLGEVVPENVHITADVRSSRTFPVSMKINSQLPAELLVRTISVAPDQAVIRGGEDTLAKVQHVEAVFNLEQNMHEKGQYRSVAELVAVDSTGKHIDKVDIDPVYVAVVVEVIDKEISTELPVKPLFLGSLAAGYETGEIEVNPTSVVVKGKASHLKDMKEAFTAEINLDGRNSDFAATLPLKLPEGVDAEPDSVNVYVKVKKQGA